MLQEKSHTRLHWVDMLRGIAMLAILWFHTEMYYAGRDLTPYAFYVQDVLATFFFLSGYVFNTNSTPRTQLISTARHLLWPYFMFTILLAVPKALAHGQPLTPILAEQILNGHASWFVASLIMARLLFIALMRYLKERPAALFVAAIVAAIMATAMGRRSSPCYFAYDLWCINESLLALVFLIAGYLYRRYEPMRPDFHIIALLVTGLAIAKTTIIYFDLKVVFGFIDITHIGFFLSDTLFFTILLVQLFRCLPHCAFLQWVGHHSLVCYFLCGAVPFAVSAGMNHIGLNFADYPYLLPVVFIVVSTTAFAATWTIHHFLPWLIRLSVLLFLPLQVHAQQLPALPVLHIQTVDGEMPSKTVINAPEGCLGTSITNNDYVPGRMVMTLKGETLYDSEEYEKKVSGMRIKIRGNSTGAFLAQPPYKIKLSKKYDLLRRDDPNYQHKEWILLSMYIWNPKMANKESNILYMLGCIISKIVGQEWTPAFDLVNVEINGEYQGMYYLMETVSRGDARVILKNTGFMIEHDPFWWNEDVYFKTDSQTNDYFRFTYKYPDSDDVTDDMQNTMQNYMNDVENVIYNNGDISQYIDMLSFAKWILIHDILGTDDTAGCNRFLCRKDDKSLLQMGPVWDFDSSFRSDGISTLHTSDMFYYPYLFNRSEFTQVYLNLWKSIKPTLLEDIKSEFETLWSKYGDVFDESMRIHQNKYPSEGKNTYRFQIDEVIDKMSDRINLLDNYINTTTIQQPMMRDAKEKYAVYHLNGQRINGSKQLQKGIYIYSGQKVVIQ